MNTKKYVQNVLASLRKSVAKANAQNTNVLKQLRRARAAAGKVRNTVMRRRRAASR